MNGPLTLLKNISTQPKNKSLIRPIRLKNAMFYILKCHPVLLITYSSLYKNPRPIKNLNCFSLTIFHCNIKTGLVIYNKIVLVCFQEVFSHHGVILRNPNIRDDDSYCNGTLSIVQYVSID